MNNILVLEDQIEQLEFLKTTLKGLGEEYEILTADNIKDALSIALKEDIHLFLLDIGLPDGCGMKFAEEIRKIPKYELTWMVFLTTYTQYMLSAFKQIHCYDYILKPYKAESILALSRKLLSQNNISSTAISTQYLSFEMKGFILKIDIKDIIFLEIYKKNCTIHTHRDQYVIKKTPLNKVLEMLPSDTFVQCHRSYVINMDFVRDLKKKGNSWEISFKEYEEKALLGETFRDTVLSKIKSV